MKNDVTWAYDLDPLVFSKIKARIVAKTKTKYKKLNITQDGNGRNATELPTIYIHLISLTERGQDLVGETINAVNMTYQVDVTVSNDQGISIVRELSSVVLEAFKSLRFGSTMPLIEMDNNGNYRTVSRFSRVIGSGDDEFR